MKYSTILVDPPWQETMSGKYKGRHNRKKELPYQTMSLKEIAAMNIGRYANDDCHLWLWTTNRFIEAGFRIMETWGFKYLAPIHWIKPSGMGNYFIHRTQTILFGYRENCYFRRARYVPNIIYANVSRKHSRKPEEVYQLIESISEEPRLELFARPLSPMFPNRSGWHTWGNEIENSAIKDSEILMRTVEG